MTRDANNWLATILVGGAIAAGVVLAPSAHARDLTVVSWGDGLQDAQNDAFFKPFQQATGIPVQQASWDGGIGILRAKVQGGNLDWDLIEVEADELAIGCEEGLYVKIDYGKIGGKDIYYPSTVSTCGIAAVLYDFSLGYNGAKLTDPPKSWSDFFDLNKYPGKRALRSGPKSTLEIALLGDGVPPQDVYKVLSTSEGVDRAFKKLDTIKSNLIWWQTGNQPIQLLTSGEVVMSDLYSGRVIAADRQDPNRNLRVMWNQSLFTSDSWVILKGSPNVDKAYKLLDYMSDPKREVIVAVATSQGMANKKTIDFVPKADQPNLPTDPRNLAKAIPIDVKFWLENYDKLNDRYTKWAAE